MKKWYVVIHKRDAFQWLKEKMASIEIDLFSPTHIELRKRSDRPSYRKKETQLFPGYLFLRFDPNELHTTTIATIPGIQGFVAFLLFEFLFPFNPAVAPLGDGEFHLSVFLDGVDGAWSLVVGNLCAGGLGVLWSLSALIIAMHCIPSWADIRLALRGEFDGGAWALPGLYLKLRGLWCRPSFGA